MTMLIAAGTARADYPNYGLLWRRLSGQPPLKESVIPGAYKKLVKAYKEVEGEDGEILLEETKKKTGLCPVMDAEKEGVAWLKNNWGLLVDCFDPEGHSWHLGKPQGFIYNPVSKEEIRNYLSKLSVTDAVKKAILRCIRIVSSSAFLEEILGTDYLLEFIDRGNKEGRRISTICDIFSSACHMAKKRWKETSRHYGENRINESYVVPKDLLENSMDRLVVEMEIKQTEEQIIGPEFITKVEFAMTLRLIINTHTEEIEEVKLCDKFIVNQPVGYYEKPLILFEKK